MSFIQLVNQSTTFFVNSWVTHFVLLIGRVWSGGPECRVPREITTELFSVLRVYIHVAVWVRAPWISPHRFIVQVAFALLSCCLLYVLYYVLTDLFDPIALSYSTFSFNKIYWIWWNPYVIIYRALPYVRACWQSRAEKTREIGRWEWEIDVKKYSIIIRSFSDKRQEETHTYTMVEYSI